MTLDIPTFTFTVPSLHDDITLDCRLYIPSRFQVHDNTGRLKAVIIAHPYAPLGGCCDDPVLSAVGGELLKHGWIIATFNFRGAAGSAGHTSWTGRGEWDDYISVAGCVMVFLDALTGNKGDEKGEDEGAARPLLILGGYSFGAIIASHLPPPEDILARLTNAEEGSAAHEIVCRANHLAREMLVMFPPPSSSSADPNSPSSPSKKRNHLCVTMGGDESSEHAKRRSAEMNRISIDLIRMKAESLSKKRKGEDVKKTASNTVSDTGHVVVPRTAYLLISRVLPPAYLSFGPFQRPRMFSGSDVDSLLTHPTLAICGDSDGFIGIKKAQIWAQKMIEQSPKPDSFTFEIVENAGHFYREDGVIRELKTRVVAWASRFEGQAGE
jgi:hypothetical protein